MSTFLIVDDSKYMRHLLGRIITSEGHTVVGEASNGQEALEEYKKVHPEIVTMDITMDSVDGLEGVKLIKAYDPNARVIMCSALGQQTLVMEAIQSGAKEFIVKPFTKDNVRDAIAHALR